MAAYSNLWGPGNKESKANSYAWGKTGFTDDDEFCRDHVCRPVIIDAHGRKKPIIACTPTHGTEQYITTTETITERVPVPQVSTYRTSSPMEVGGFVNNGSNWPVSVYHDRPPRVDNFIRNIQDEASQADRINLESSSHWHQKPSSYSYDSSDSYGGINGYGRTNDYVRPSDAGINRWNKPPRDPYFGSPGVRNQMVSDDWQNPHINTEGGWVRPTRLGWSNPSSNDGPLTNPTNDIGTAIGFLKDAVNGTPLNAAPPQRQFTAPTINMPKVQTYGPTIDSREAQRRYAGFSGPPQTVRTADTYSSAIDSREAARRYKGEMM